MKERFEEMTLDQLDAIHETLCYLFDPDHKMTAGEAQLWSDLEYVRSQKFSKYLTSDEYKQKCKETDDLYQSMFKGVF